MAFGGVERGRDPVEIVLEQVGEWFRVLLAAALGATCLLIMIALEGWHLPASVEDAVRHPYWATLLLLPIVTVVWFLAGPAFAGRGDPVRDKQAASPSTGQR